jgi:hypothetical protein
VEPIILKAAAWAAMLNICRELEEIHQSYIRSQAGVLTLLARGYMGSTFTAKHGVPSSFSGRKYMHLWTGREYSTTSGPQPGIAFIHRQADPVFIVV